MKLSWAEQKLRAGQEKVYGQRLKRYTSLDGCFNKNKQILMNFSLIKMFKNKFVCCFCTWCYLTVKKRRTLAESVRPVTSCKQFEALLTSCKPPGFHGNVGPLRVFNEVLLQGQNPACPVTLAAIRPSDVNVNVIYHGNLAAFLSFCVAVKRAGPEPAEGTERPNSWGSAALQLNGEQHINLCFSEAHRRSHTCEETHVLQLWGLFAAETDEGT